MQIDDSLIDYITYNDKQIPILNIKKGTLLFRYVYDNPGDNVTINKMAPGSFLGIQNEKDENEYCLPSNYNVFFYPYPYVMDTNKYLKPTASKMMLFETTTDIKVALFLKPSLYTRNMTGEENEISVSCDNFNFCYGLKGRSHDPCFKEEFMKQHPEIMGIYGISFNDNKRFLQQFNKPIFKPFRKFIHMYEDNKTIGVPELMLYPLRRRGDEIVTKVEGDVYDFIKKHEKSFNYEAVNVFNHKPLKMYDELFVFMNNINKKYRFDKASSFFISKT
jgi:hypothetical protein